MLLFLYVTFSG